MTTIKIINTILSVIVFSNLRWAQFTIIIENMKARKPTPIGIKWIVPEKNKHGMRKLWKIYIISIIINKK